MATFLIVVVLAVIVVVGLFAMRGSGAGGATAVATLGPTPGAPCADSAYFESILRRAGAPVTPHNLFAVQERIGIMFTTKAHQFIDGMGTPRDLAAFIATNGYPQAEMHLWPQRVLNGIVYWNRESIPYIQDFPQRYADILLEEVNSGGGFFGDTHSPLPTATDWHMKGIRQAGVRPMSPPGPLAAA